MKLAICAVILTLNISAWIDGNNSTFSHFNAFFTGVFLCATLYFLVERLKKHTGDFTLF